MHQRTVLTALRVELTGVAATLLVFALFHFGVRLGPLADTPLLAGAIAESLLAACTAAAVALTFVRPAPALSWGLAANLIDTAGVVLGIVATRGGTTELNFVYHRTILGVTALATVVLAGRAMLASRRRAVQ